MNYIAVPDRRIPYDNDGTLVYYGRILDGANYYLTQQQRIDLQRYQRGGSLGSIGGGGVNWALYFFFPEQREVDAYFLSGYGRSGIGGVASPSLISVTGSNDTTNGSDGSWETASLPGGAVIYGGLDNANVIPFDAWRYGILPISFTGPKKNVRLNCFAGDTMVQVHLYGKAAGGAMAHDLVFINQDDTPGAEYTSVEDFGDQPLGTTVVRQFRVKNTSATRTATNLNLQCNDTDFAIATSSGGPWVTTINIASLGPGAESATLYIRCTTPAPGAALLPRFARILATCDSGFFG